MNYSQIVPVPLFCLTLQHLIDDPLVIEYFMRESPVETEHCIPIILHKILSENSCDVWPDAALTLKSLMTLWGIENPVAKLYTSSHPRNGDENLYNAVEENNHCLIPYLLRDRKALASFNSSPDHQIEAAVRRVAPESLNVLLKELPPSMKKLTTIRDALNHALERNKISGSFGSPLGEPNECGSTTGPDVRLVRVLLRHGASADVPIWRTRTFTVASHWSDDVVKLMFDSGAPYSRDILFSFADTGRLESVKLLIPSASTIDLNDALGVTVNSLKWQRPGSDMYVPIIAALVHAGARNPAALELAREYGRNDIIKLLTSV